MPRHVRNFWLDGNIDGRESDITGGPRSKEGGFGLIVYQRDDGSVTKAIHINGWVRTDDKLILEVTTPDKGVIFRNVTER